MTINQVFNYSQYETDYITQYLREYGDVIPDWFRVYLSGTSSVESDRDDDLEDYLSAQTYVPSMALVASTQAITSASGTFITFDAIDFQSTSLFEWTVSDPTKLTVTEGGICIVTGNVKYAASSGGDYRTAQLFVGAVDIGGGTTVGTLGGNGDPQVPAVTVYNFVAGDYVRLFANQNTGSDLNASSARLSLSFLGNAG